MHKSGQQRMPSLYFGTEKTQTSVLRPQKLQAKRWTKPRLQFIDKNNTKTIQNQEESIFKYVSLIHLMQIQPLAWMLTIRAILSWASWDKFEDISVVASGK